MGKALGIALALTLALSLSATAGEKATGTVKAVDTANQSFVLEDGTQLWVSESHLTELKPGDKVEATYEMQGDRKVVIDLERRTIGPDGAATTNFAATIWTHPDSVEGAE